MENVDKMSMFAKCWLASFVNDLLKYHTILNMTWFKFCDV